MIFFRAFVPDLMSGLQLYKPPSGGFIPEREHAACILVARTDTSWPSYKGLLVLRFDDELTFHPAVTETATIATME
jgi:hypothetical protein